MPKVKFETQPVLVNFLNKRNTAAYYPLLTWTLVPKETDVGTQKQIARKDLHVQSENISARDHPKNEEYA